LNVSASVTRVDADDDLGLVGQLVQQAHLDVGVEAGQDAGGVVIEDQLAAELQVELVVEASDALQNRFGLLFEVLLVVERHAVGLHAPSSGVCVPPGTCQRPVNISGSWPVAAA
jgi:hypothetical protein